jgi:hypothetical protein
MAAKKSADLTVVESGAAPTQVTVPTQDSNVFSAIERIMTDPNASVERANQAFEFYQKVQAAAARKAFDEAVADAKGKFPDIIKNRKGHNNKMYADFSAFTKAIDPILSEYGLHYRFRTQQDDKIHVTCVLSHRLGHSEENTLSGPPDTTGNKNAIMAIGSTLTYLQRYTLGQSLGLAASEDDDGQAAGEATALLAPEQVKTIKDLLETTLTEEENFMAWVTARLKYPTKVEEIRAKDFEQVHDKLVAKRDQMKGAGK